ncbi:MAG: DUF4248 domain-containing protein [Schleiferiaceae bacterium]|jgi:hypothetical protein
MEKEFEIRTYGFGELARLYLPNIKPASASKRLRAWIKKNQKLTKLLNQLGYKHTDKVLTPNMVQKIIYLIGTP